MKRRLVTLAAAGSLLLCIATVVLWVRSDRNPQPPSGASRNTQPRREVTGAISGRVVDADGQPLADCGVHFEFKPRAGEREFAIRVTTDSAGDFACRKMKPGRYLLWCGSKDLGWFTEEVEVVPGEEIGVGQLQLSKP